MRTGDAIKYFGSVEKLAKFLKISRDSIYKWGAVVPHLRQYELEIKTNGQLKSFYSVQKLDRENNERKQQQQP